MFIVLLVALFSIGLPVAAIKRLANRSRTPEAMRERVVARYVLGFYVAMAVVVVIFNLS